MTHDPRHRIPKCLPTRGTPSLPSPVTKTHGLLPSTYNLFGASFVTSTSQGVPSKSGAIMRPPVASPSIVHTKPRLCRSCRQFQALSLVTRLMRRGEGRRTRAKVGPDGVFGAVFDATWRGGGGSNCAAATAPSVSVSSVVVFDASSLGGGVDR